MDQLNNTPTVFLLITPFPKKTLEIRSSRYGSEKNYSPVEVSHKDSTCLKQVKMDRQTYPDLVVLVD